MALITNILLRLGMSSYANTRAKNNFKWMLCFLLLFSYLKLCNLSQNASIDVIISIRAFSKCSINEWYAYDESEFQWDNQIDCDRQSEGF